MSDQPWTPMIGLRRALFRVAIRSAIALVVWAAVLWLITPVLNFLPARWAIVGVTTLVLIAPGVAIGHGLSRRLTEIAGMAGVPVAAIAITFGWAVAILAVVLASMLRPLGEWQYEIAIAGTGFWTMLWQLKATLLED